MPQMRMRQRSQRNDWIVWETGSAGNTEQLVPKPETAEVPGAEAGAGPLAQHRAGGQTTCRPWTLHHRPSLTRPGSSLLSSAGASKGTCHWFALSCLSPTPSKAVPERLLINES